MNQLQETSSTTASYRR